MTKATEVLITSAAKSGMWAVLSVFLIMYVIQDGRKREDRYIEREDRYIEREKEYQSTIKESREANLKLSEGLKSIEILRNDVKDIKDEVKRRD